MKYHFLVATAAIFCGGFSDSATAQSQVPYSSPTPAIRLVGIQVDSDESPLDFGFAADSSQKDPQSLPPESLRRRSPVDSIIENSNSAIQGSMFTGTAAHGGGQIIDGTHFAPLYWSQASYSHTALADYMRLQWCADGLWDTHPAERAAQCAKQAERIAGAHRHRCGHCGQAGVHAYSGDCCQSRHSGRLGGCGGGCSLGKGNCCWTINGDCPPVNRYRLPHRHGCSACGQNAGCGNGAAYGRNGCHGCSACDQAPATGDHVSQSQRDAPPTSANPSNSLPAAGLLPSNSSTNYGSNGKVAFLPLTVNR